MHVRCGKLSRQSDAFQSSVPRARQGVLADVCRLVRRAQNLGLVVDIGPDEQHPAVEYIAEASAKTACTWWSEHDLARDQGRAVPQSLRQAMEELPAGGAPSP